MANTDLQKLKVLNKIEDWANGVKKESENMKRILEAEFKEEIRHLSSDASIIIDRFDDLDMDVDYGLLFEINCAKANLKAKINKK